MLASCGFAAADPTVLTDLDDLTVLTDFDDLTVLTDLDDLTGFAQLADFRPAHAFISGVRRFESERDPDPKLSAGSHESPVVPRLRLPGTEQERFRAAARRLAAPEPGRQYARRVDDEQMHLLGLGAADSHDPCPTPFENDRSRLPGAV